jgi:hypothetical protein
MSLKAAQLQRETAARVAAHTAKQRRRLRAERQQQQQAEELKRTQLERVGRAAALTLALQQQQAAVLQQQQHDSQLPALRTARSSAAGSHPDTTSSAPSSSRRHSSHAASATAATTERTDRDAAAAATAAEQEDSHRMQLMRRATAARLQRKAVQAQRTREAEEEEIRARIREYEAARFAPRPPLHSTRSEGDSSSRRGSSGGGCGIASAAGRLRRRSSADSRSAADPRIRLHMLPSGSAATTATIAAAPSMFSCCTGSAVEQTLEQLEVDSLEDDEDACTNTTNTAASTAVAGKRSGGSPLRGSGWRAVMARRSSSEPAAVLTGRSAVDAVPVAELQQQQQQQPESVPEDDCYSAEITAATATAVSSVLDVAPSVSVARRKKPARAVWRMEPVPLTKAYVTVPKDAGRLQW